VKVRDAADCTAGRGARVGGRLEREHPSGIGDWMMLGEGDILEGEREAERSDRCCTKLA
jgi:hypothetical protein